MGGGSWTTASYNVYTTNTRGMDADAFATSNMSVQEVYKNYRLSEALNPEGVVRECRDTEEHPNTVPVILALDVTGSMGDASVKVAKKLNEIMTKLYEDKDIPDVEFCIMGIGDLYCDTAPIQMSQFESDVRIAEQLDQLYFEAGGGGNDYESYTAAWYMGINHCDLDCWKRGRKGIIITMGDEEPNPFLPIKGRHRGLISATGDSLQGDVETSDLLPKVLEKYDVYHISVNDSYCSYRRNNKDGILDEKWRDLLGENYSIATLDTLSDQIVDIIKSRAAAGSAGVNANGEVTW